jgi:hypothetical protein
VTLLGCNGALLAATAPAWKSAIHRLQRPIVHTIGVSVLAFLNIGSIAGFPVRVVFKVFINTRCGWSFKTSDCGVSWSSQTIEVFRQHHSKIVSRVDAAGVSHTGRVPLGKD